MAPMMPATLVGPLIWLSTVPTLVKVTRWRPPESMICTRPGWVALASRWNSFVPLPCSRSVSGSPSPPS
jgi:hypothetical protein